MAKVETYRNAGTSGKFSQIRLDSGNRVLVSVAQDGLAVFKIGFFRVPYGTVVKLTEGREFLGLYKKHGFDLNADLLDIAVQIVMKCKTTDEIKTAFHAEVQEEDMIDLMSWYSTKL